MLTTHATESATVLLIVSCSFVFRVVGFIIDDLKKKQELITKSEIVTQKRYTRVIYKIFV